MKRLPFVSEGRLRSKIYWSNSLLPYQPNEEVMISLAIRLCTLIVLAVLAVSPTAMATAPSGKSVATTIPAASRAPAVAWFIPHGCPYNLDKECHINGRGKIVCRCVS